MKPLIIFVFDPKDSKASQKSTLQAVEQFCNLAETNAVNEWSSGWRTLGLLEVELLGGERKRFE